MNIVCVHIAEIERIDSLNEFTPYLKLLSAEKRKRLSRLRLKEDFIRSFVSDLLIRVLAVKWVNLSNSDIRFATNAYGKPYLEGRQFEFNASHSGDWVAAAISESPVGIDIEKIQPVEMAIARRFFSENEYLELSTMKEDEKNRYFFDLWTLKESYIKAYGEGLSIPLNLISFSLVGEEIVFENRHSRKNYYFRQYQVDDWYKLSVCSPNRDFPERANIWSLDQLFSDAHLLL